MGSEIIFFRKNIPQRFNIVVSVWKPDFSFKYRNYLIFHQLFLGEILKTWLPFHMNECVKWRHFHILLLEKKFFTSGNTCFWRCSKQSDVVAGVGGDGSLAEQLHGGMLACCVLRLIDHAAEPLTTCTAPKSMRLLDKQTWCALTRFSEGTFPRICEQRVLIQQKLCSSSSAASTAGVLPKPSCRTGLCIAPAWGWQVCTSESMQCGSGLESAF